MWRHLISISEMAKLHGLTRQTLIHYDTIGLFKPIEVDDKGYRYYSRRQIPFLREICFLKALGIGLKEIMAHLQGRDPQREKVLLERHKKVLMQEIAHLNYLRDAINHQEIQKKQDSLGPITGKEKRTAFWVVVAIILWMTDSVHGVDIGWVTLFIAVMMAMPKIGGVLTPSSWSGVPVQTLLFLTAAVAIGRVGGATGMNAWLAQTLLPSTVPENMFILGAFITLVALVIHMCFGSVIAVMGIVIPAMLAFTQTMGISPVIPTMIAYSAVNTHFILPFHNLAILVGTGPENGLYSEKETVRFGVPFTVVLFIISCVIELPWWKVIGLW